MKIAIIGAMDYEVHLLIEEMQAVKASTVAGIKFYEGTIDNKSVVVAVCGIGKVNAALCTQIIISQFAANCIINTGVAGALKVHLEPQDIVVSTDLAYHDMDVTNGGNYAYGDIPRMTLSYFKADKKLSDLTLKLARQTVKTQAVYLDRIVSGDAFVADKAKKDWILKHFNAAATEMEGAAIAHVCYLNEIPFVVIRAISDRADGSADDDFEQFAKAAALTSAKIVIALVEQLS